MHRNNIYYAYVEVQEEVLLADPSQCKYKQTLELNLCITN